MGNRFNFMQLFRKEEKKLPNSPTNIELTDFKQETKTLVDYSQELSTLVHNLPSGTLKVEINHKNKVYPSRVQCAHEAKRLIKQATQSSKHIEDIKAFIKTLKDYTKTHLPKQLPKQAESKEPSSPIHNEQSVSHDSKSSSRNRGRR